MRHRHTLIAVSSAVFLGLFVFPLGVRAQIGTASLSGTVTDPSGAAVPGAQVTIQSSTRKASRQTVTDSAGNYVLPSLLPDSYQLVVSAKGFETKTTTNIQLASGQGSTLNVALQIGAAVTQVTVSEHAPLLQSTTATLGSELQTRMVTNLPLLGRDFTALLSTLPGASPPGLSYFIDYSPGGGAGTSGGDFAFYGQRPRDNEFLIDGVPNAQYEFNAVPMYPPPDAIAEMKVQSGTDSGAYGWASGANINLVTKSGTNEYHGTLWEYVRNDVFNARGFFDPSRNTVRWNQFGAAAGGPLQIPHILSKKRAWYVFGWFEGLRIPGGNSYYQLVPTAAELNGNFAGDPTIYNPYTSVVAPDGSLISRQPFPGNQIPVGATNACSPNPTCIDPNAVLIAKTYSPLPNLTTPGPGNTNWVGHQTNRNSYTQWSGRVDHQFGSKDNFYGRYTDARNPQAQDFGFNGTGWVDNKHFTNMAVSDTHVFTPSFLLTARFGWQRDLDTQHNVGPFISQQVGLCDTFPLSFNGNCYLPSILLSPYPGYGQGYGFDGPEDLFTWSADSQKIIGKHTLQFGGTFTRDHFKADNQTGTQIQFGTQPTADPTGANGFALASFLLGLPSTSSRVVGSTEGDMIANYPSLYAQDTWRVTKKLTLNLGVRWDPQITMINQKGSGTFVWETGQYVFDTKNPITGEPANGQRGLIPSDKNNVAPRFGAAYAVDSKTVVRASYGIFYDVLGETAQDQQGNRGNWPYAFPQTVGSENTGLPEFYFENPFPGPAQGSTTPLGCQQCLEVYPSATRTPYVQQWSLSVQRQLTSSLMLQTAYFGSHGIDMSGQIVDNTALTPGTNNYQLRQRWPEFPPYVNNGFNQFPSFYNGLSVELRKQYSRSVSFLVSYTWSKAISVSDSLVASPYYPFIQPTRFDIPNFKGPAGYDVTHRLSASYVWDIPAKTGNKIADAVVANWSLSGIATFDSGTPYYAVLYNDNSNIGSVPGRATSLPNLVGNPVLSNPTPAEWFNTSAFAIPPFGTLGNAGKHAMYSDGLANFDFSLRKSWPFKENKSFDLRGDFFNAFNQHTFGIPNFTVDDPSTFGTVSSVRQGGRQIQISMQLRF